MIVLVGAFNKEKALVETFFMPVTLCEGLYTALLATVVSGVGWTHKGGDKDDPWLSL